MIKTAPKRPAPFSFNVSTSDAPPRASEVPAAWTALPGGVIAGSEIVLLAIKPSMWRPLFDSAPWMSMCALLAAALVYLTAPLPGLSVTATAQCILLIGLTRLAIAVVRWVPRWHVLTNQRIIDIRGVRAPRISDCPLVEIRNTILQPSAPEKLTQLGTIIFVTDQKSQPPFIWRSIAKPELVHAKIRRAIENAIDQQTMGI